MQKTPNSPIARSRGRRSGGFTLTEVMLALGILGFALPMVAAALLAGMLETEESADNTMSTLTAENALAVLRCRVKHSDLSPAWGAGSFQRLPNGLIDDEDLAYAPFGEDEFRTKFACVIMGRRMAGSANDYLFAAMVYRKLRDDDTVTDAGFGYDGATTVNPDPTQTYVRLTSSGLTQFDLVRYYLMRMSLKP